MRKIEIYTVYDNISELYHNSLIYAHNDNDAKRGFIEALKKHNRPQDLILFHVGQYDRVDGKIKSNNLPRLVLSGIDIGKENEK